jgi:hypothetical protein
MAKEEVFAVRLSGTRPLLMHRIPHELGARSGREPPGSDPMGEAKKALYFDKDGKVIIPSLNILACIRTAARDKKVTGKRTYRDYIFPGLRIEPEEIPLLIPDGRPAEEAWVLDLRPVVVQKARIIRARPRFDQWALEFKLVILDPIIRVEALKDMLKEAGKYVGLLDHRPLFGLFNVEKFERVE